VGDLLALTLLNPERVWRTGELADRTGNPYPTVSRELRRLGQADILVSETVGRSRLWRANTANPNYRPLSRLVGTSFGPAQVVAEEFSEIEGVDEVMIYGSWAARSSGEPGPAPHDIDVLVLGRPARTAVYGAAQRAEQRLGLEVNAATRPSEGWANADDGFAEHVKASPLVRVLPSRGLVGSGA